MRLGGSKVSEGSCGLENSLVRPSFQEWLETDGLGGFASSTTLGIHTRRYHGWLFVSWKEVSERWLCLSKLEDAVETADGVFELSSNHYPGTTHPRGVENLLGFGEFPVPHFVFRVAKSILFREVFMVKGMPGVFCTYHLFIPGGQKGPGENQFTLRLRPLFNCRFYHHLSREGSFKLAVRQSEHGLFIEGYPFGATALLTSSCAAFVEDPTWYKNMIYRKERERGLDYSEDHFSPGRFAVPLNAGEEVVFWAGPISRDKVSVISPESRKVTHVPYKEFARNLAFYAEVLRKSEARRRKILLSTKGGGLLGRLALSGDRFIVESQGKTSVIAGYHWFGEWGRDTFISLPGLFLTTGRFREAKEVFLRFSEAVRGGLVPNTFWEGRGAAYNSVDASLWFIDALAKYRRASGDGELVRILLPKVKEIVDSYIMGTCHHINVDPSGLLHAGDEETQVTWMDARVGERPVTSRHGYPVEVNALWIQALYLLGKWEEEFSGDSSSASRYLNLARQASGEFGSRFYWPGVGLYDRLVEEGPIEEIRPNQVIAASVRGLALPPKVLREVWDTAVKELLTPYGLRTLSPFARSYKGTYSGGPAERDEAYHQGSSWPWLLGPLFDLSKRIETQGNSGTAFTDALFSKLTLLVASLDQNPCLGTIFEVSSGDFPYEPGGTVAQAWSVAEITRIVDRMSSL